MLTTGESGMQEVPTGAKLYSPNTRSFSVAATNITYEPIDSIAPSLNKIEPKKQVHVYNI